MALHSETNPSYEIQASAVIEGKLDAMTLTRWLLSQEGLPLAFSSAGPDVVRDVQKNMDVKKRPKSLKPFLLKSPVSWSPPASGD